MSTFQARIFGTGLPGGGAAAAARWRDDRLEVTAGDRTWFGAVERVEAAGWDGRLRVIFRVPESSDSPFALFVEADARRAFAAGAPDDVATQVAGAARAERRRERRFRVAGAGISLALLLPLVLLVAFLARSEAVAGWIVDRIPPDQEARLGELALAQARAQMRLETTGPAAEAVRLIGERLTTGTRLQYRWFVAERPEINAFAAPGGVVVVFRGLIEAAETPEEVAGVIAHEVAHVELRHSLRAAVKGMGLRALLSLALGDLSGGALERAASDLTELRFSRDAEREADAEGVRRMVVARIDPQGMIRFFERLQKQEGATMPALLSTHPATTERLERLRRDAAVELDSTPLPLDWATVKRGT